MIEVALPLDDINIASAREKSIRHGHPSTLHLWWARRPLAACRAVLFASLIDDPDQEGVPAELLAEIDRLPAPELLDWQELSLAGQRRQRLFRFIKLLVQWESTNDERVLATAHRLIMAATGGNPPPIYDPFAGGGSIPLEAQRLGLEAHASDLNPVAVLINKALIEIPPKFAGMPPVNPDFRLQNLDFGFEGDQSQSQSKIPNPKSKIEWKGAAGLAADVRYYGKWMRDEAERRIGHLYPKVQVIQESDGSYRHATQSEIQNHQSKIQNLTVIAWLWARTVQCPNPACGAQMPLVRSFALSTKKGKETWVEPIVDFGLPVADLRQPEPGNPKPTITNPQSKRVRFEVRSGSGKLPEPSKLGRGAKFRCLCCEQVSEEQHIKSEAKAGRMSAQLMAIVAEGNQGRIYLPPSEEQEQIAASAQPEWVPNQEMPANPRWFSPPVYGLTSYGDLFTRRQLVALTTFTDLVGEARQRICQNMEAAGFGDPYGYADAVATYLAFGVDKNTLTNTTQATWQSNPDRLTQAYSRQAIPMTWDYAEANPLSDAGGGYVLTSTSLGEVLERLCVYYYNESCLTGFKRWSGAHRRGNQRGRGTNRFVHISDPTFGAAAMGDSRRQMSPVVVGNPHKDGIHGARWYGQQDAEEHADLRQAQQGAFFFSPRCSRTRKKCAKMTRVR